jgi:Trypsin
MAKRAKTAEDDTGLDDVTWRRIVAAATVKLPKRGGLGILVPGRVVLTAAHCVDWYVTGGMALGDHCVEDVETKVGQTLRMQIVAVEPVADIAVLGCADTQVFCDDADTFDEFCEATAPVPVSTVKFGRLAPVPVQVLTHRGTWIAATATRHSELPGARVWVRFEQQIESGTSGGPVIDERGRLVGVVSFAEGRG